MTARRAKQRVNRCQTPSVEGERSCWRSATSGHGVVSDGRVFAADGRLSGGPGAAAWVATAAIR